MDRTTPNPHARRDAHPLHREWDALDALQRRDFLRLAAASLVLPHLAACSRQPPEDIVPLTHWQTGFTPGVPQWYATTLLRDGYGVGALVRSDDARPTKIEGNPDHPASRGATDAVIQAQLLALYDPARSATVRQGRRLTSWGAFDRWLRARLSTLEQRGGEGLWLLMPPCASPTIADAVRRARERFPRAVFARHDPRGGAALEGTRLAAGRPLLSVHDLAQADAVVCVDVDLFTEPARGVRNGFDFANRRREGLAGNELRPALFVAEPVPTCTGSRADRRLALPRRDGLAALCALARELGIDAPPPRSLHAAARRWVAGAAGALRAARGRGLVLVGDAQPPAAHALALAINHRLGAIGTTLRLIEPFHALPPDAPTTDDCARALRDGAVDMLLVVGVNPVYEHATHDKGFGEAMAHAASTVHMGLHDDETAGAAEWHVPMTHTLEQWGDARAFNGVASLIQPLINPIYNGRSPLTLLNAVAGDPLLTDAETVERVWRARVDSREWLQWRREALRAGFIPETAAPPVDAHDVRLPQIALDDTPNDRFSAVIDPDPYLGHGEHAANAWLQELPDPITQTAWHNVALLAPSTAKTLGVREGEIVRLRSGLDPASFIDIPALPLRGVAENTIGLRRGYGRTSGGPVAVGRGVDVARLMSVANQRVTDVALDRTGQQAEIVLAQLHDTMEGREPVRVVKPGGEPERTKPDIALPLYQGPRYDAPQQWGMTIDLAVCTGCSACVVACQAENNIPVVGPEEVRRGRRMHWLRVDRYFKDDDILMQPLACVHCENAPCELVCPTGATQHSADGMNEMNYARCIGTRYCSNNCPYKVRRFNFFRYADDREQITRMRNPRVTTRGLGVMEKCTYCVQRVRAAEMSAREDDSLIPDGAVRTACQQACPTGAIVFGDVADDRTRVSTLKRSERAYKLLAHLNTEPRTSYLADVRPGGNERA